MSLFDQINQTVAITTAYEMVRQRFEDVPGYLSGVEGYLLTMLAAHGPGAGAIVEIGSFKGRSTCFLAFGTELAGRDAVTAVDRFTGSPEHQKGGEYEDADVVAAGSTFGAFIGNLARHNLSKQVKPRRMSSAEAAREWSGPIRLLFIDGDHSYEATAADFLAWEPHVVPGGLIGFHDVDNWPGVTRFVEELRRQPRFREEGRAVSLVVFSKLS